MIIPYAPTVFVLLFVLLAGFAGGASVGLVHEYFTKPLALKVSDLALVFGMFGVPNMIAIALFVKVWRSPMEWTLLGHTRRVWQILLVIAYGLGLVGSVAAAL